MIIITQSENKTTNNYLVLFPSQVKIVLVMEKNFHPFWYRTRSVN